MGIEENQPQPANSVYISPASAATGPAPAAPAGVALLDEPASTYPDSDPEPARPQPRNARFGRVFRYGMTLEAALYGLIILAAIFTRFYDLGFRALHHDEGVHAWYSWKFYNGEGYEQEPWKHGPFLYHLQALVFWIFGDSDQTARVSVAIFGVLTCLLPLGLRKELGRWGALTASFLLLVSPMFLYYSRFLREDIFTAFATLGLFIGLVRFVDRPGGRWWYASMLALALLVCTKEVSFFYLVLFGGFVGAWLCWQLAPRLLLILGGYGLLALVVFFFTMGLYPPPAIPYETPTAASIGKYVNSLLVHPVLWTLVVLVVVGLAVGWFAFQEVATQRRRFMVDREWATPPIGAAHALFAPYREVGTVAFAVAWLGRHWKVTWAGLGLAFVFYFVFYTGFFSDIPQGSVGLFSGLWYWMGQQGVARGNQPWFYYFFMLPLYEPLALMLGTLAGGYIVVRALRYGFRRQHRTVLVPLSELEPGQADELDGDRPASDTPSSETLVEVEVAVRPAGNALWPGRRRRERHPYFGPLFLVTWAFGSLALYTWASEKMPWLTVQVALPFILLAAYLMDGVWSGIERFFRSSESRRPIIGSLSARTFFWIQAGGLTGAVFLLYMTMLYLTSAELRQSSATGVFNWLIVWIPPTIALLFFTAAFSFAGLRLALQTTLAVIFGVLTFYLLHTGFTFAYDHGDVPLEMGIYTQTAPDTYRVVRELNLVTTMLPEQKRTPILYDTELRTPLDFYLRDYVYKRRVTDFSELSQARGSQLNLNDYQILMISDSKLGQLDENQKRSLAENFIARHYTFHFWFEEGQYRDFDRATGIQLNFLQGKPALAAVRDAGNSTVINKDEIMTAERLQQIAGAPGALDKLYNSNGGNAALLHLTEAGKSLYQLRTPGDASRLWRYVMFRDQVQPLGRREFTLYIKKELAGIWRQYADLVEFPISRPQ